MLIDYGALAMRIGQNIKGWVTALAVIGTVSVVLPVVGAQASHQRKSLLIFEPYLLFAPSIAAGQLTKQQSINVWQKLSITKHGPNYALANWPLLMLLRTG